MSLKSDLVQNTSYGEMTMLEVKKNPAFYDQVNKSFLHLDLLIDKICFWIFLL